MCDSAQVGGVAALLQGRLCLRQYFVFVWIAGGRLSAKREVCHFYSTGCKRLWCTVLKLTRIVLRAFFFFPCLVCAFWGKKACKTCRMVNICSDVKLKTL